MSIFGAHHAFGHEFLELQRYYYFASEFAAATSNFQCLLQASCL